MGYLLGALDHDEQVAVEESLQQDLLLGQQLAQARLQLAALEVLRQPVEPPAGLAERTCRVVFAQSKPTLRDSRRHPATPPEGAAGWIRRIGWVDVAVAVGLLVAGALLIVPAIQHSRFRAQVIACQRNLQELGLALTDYSDRHDEYFPRIPTRGRLAAAGIYAPVLWRDQYLTEPHRVLCPGSPSANQPDFYLPSLEELESATTEELEHLRASMGGNYGYTLGHLVGGVYRDTRNLRRPTFALLSDAPNFGLPGRQSLNHGGRGQNVFFEDGRILFLLCSRLTDGGDDFFCNDEGLIAAGIHADDAVLAPSPTPPLRYVDDH